MRSTKTYDKEKVSLNLARLKKGGETFEIVIDPDKVIEYKTKKDVDVSEVLRYEKIFSDARKGYEASEEHLKSIFETVDPLKIGKIILDTGEIQFTQEYRERERTKKRKKLLDIITRNAIDPTSGLPHPRTRIENAFEEANIKVDNFRTAEDQVKDVLSVLKSILPIKFAVRQIQIRISAKYAPKAYSLVDRYSNIMEDTWQNDGSWVCKVEMPAGMQNELFDELNKLTQGSVESKILEER